MKSNEPMEMSHVFGAFEGTTILNGDAETAAIYARVRWRLESQGLRIPENDIWIAAASIQARLPLITRDLHFQRIPELTVLAY
jgi:predicted nucleic acid-binding protein